MQRAPQTIGQAQRAFWQRPFTHQPHKTQLQQRAAVLQAQRGVAADVGRHQPAEEAPGGPGVPARVQRRKGGAVAFVRVGHAGQQQQRAFVVVQFQGFGQGVEPVRRCRCVNRGDCGEQALRTRPLLLQEMQRAAPGGLGFSAGIGAQLFGDALAHARSLEPERAAAGCHRCPVGCQAFDCYGVIHSGTSAPRPATAGSRGRGRVRRGAVRWTRRAARSARRSSLGRR